MLSLQECIDMCGLSPKQAKALSEHATLPEVAAAQAKCAHLHKTKKQPHHRASRKAAGDSGDPEETAACELLAKLHGAEEFSDLKVVLDRFCAIETAKDNHRSG